MLMIATFSISLAGTPTITELSLMPVSTQWVPVEDAFEKQLIDRLVSEGRSFIKALRYNLGRASTLACATLTDCEGAAPVLYVVPPSSGEDSEFLRLGGQSARTWSWNPSCEPIPALPCRKHHPACFDGATQSAARRQCTSEGPIHDGAVC
jgi:hypothetical protein